MPSSSAIVLGNIVAKMNKGMCVCWGNGGFSENDMRGGGDDFLVSLGILLFGVRPLRFSVVVDGLVLVGCEVVAVRLADRGVVDSSFGGCLELCDVKEWTSVGVFNMMDVTGGFFRGLPGLLTCLG